MDDFKIVVFILSILISLAAIANKKKFPYPVILVAAGLVIGFVPQLPNLALDPEIVFIIMLPPLLYDAALKTSWHEFRTAIRPISALAITLVFFTTVSVAITAYFFIPGFSWPLAFVLGAVVSPPDAVAASGIIKGLGLNKKVITILEGESLVNDASALIAYRYAVTAVTTGTFVFWKAGLQFFLVAGVGILIGFVIGWLFVFVHKRIRNNPVVETSLSLLAPFLSYLAAEQYHMSGVLAVVTTGLVISWRSPEVFSYQARMRTRVVWDVLIFLLQGFVFILIGLQLPMILRNLQPHSFLDMLGYGLLVSCVAIVVRILWVFSGSYFLKRKNNPRTTAAGSDDDTWKNVLVVAWTGTRGVISLAAALALPLVLTDGSVFPQRDAIIFLTFVVIFVTLVIQGLSLPLLIRWLKIKPQDVTASEEKALQLHLATGTLDFIEQDLSNNISPALRDQLISEYRAEIKQLNNELLRQEMAIQNDEVLEPLPPSELQVVQAEIAGFRRELLLKLHKDGDYSDSVIRQAEREMDIEELRLDPKISKGT